MNAPFSYRDPGAPDWYACSDCHLTQVKLWRPVHRDTDALCVCCLSARNTKLGHARDQFLPSDVDLFGKIAHGLGRTDQVGGYLPCIPLEDGDGAWGYGSVPDVAVTWWKNLALSSKRRVPPERIVAFAWPSQGEGVRSVLAASSDEEAKDESPFPHDRVLYVREDVANRAEDARWYEEYMRGNKARDELWQKLSALEAVHSGGSYSTWQAVGLVTRLAEQMRVEYPTLAESDQDTKVFLDACDRLLVAVRAAPVFHVNPSKSGSR